MNRPDEELIRELRAARLEPASEPDWDRMAADIASACEQVEAERQRSILGRLRALLAPRYLVVTAAAAALVLAWVTLRADGDPAPELAAQSVPAPEAPPALRAPQLEALHADELDELAVALDSSAWAELPAGAPDLEAGTDPLPPEVAAAIAGVAEPAGEVHYVTGFGLGVFEEPDYGDWVDDMNESDLDALAAYLAEVVPG